ncbi:hypothetical protein [Clostridium butyricum]|uniref:hypothetical protein n=1 Tax=Clostridium butyricum TaxID=1492 RepID=UPI002ABD2772|nr:hypothetical protein [Clostridium butyricum]
MFYKIKLFPDSAYNIIYIESSTVMYFSLIIWVICMMCCGYKYFTVQSKEIYMMSMIIMSVSMIMQILAAQQC